MRKHADYEYKCKNGVLRVERGELGWCWRFINPSGEHESSNDLGELYDTKREAKAEGLAYAAQRFAD